jgi:hypothetical protein
MRSCLRKWVRRHASSVLQVGPPQCIATTYGLANRANITFSSGGTKALCRSLPDPGLWAYELHLKPAGARIFTKDIADYFIDAIKNE